ncbi:H-type small acid-soluble spore protein [Clostridium sp. YIM B02505]|uniref:Small, acid-soluble spore protein H n=1 Tax=Clostridium yunnanense TaxID=2800325 RepID=A0ABS1ER95_9CLOT|nr:H-type small acid-soluble spore protein [Clostridium yunnanense]MBK1811914.1 H-type small acid-soluble spore protein [Clostridium yunnanense]
MDRRRAEEILSSPDIINVTYKGEQIYIERIDDTKEIAYIHPLNQPTGSEQVPLGSLQEQ